MLIYGILFINDCLAHLKITTSFNEAVKVLTNVALDNFTLPGTPGFPLNNVYQVPVQDHNSMDLLKTYIQQFRQELAMRLLERVYSSTDSKEYPQSFAGVHKKKIHEQISIKVYGARKIIKTRIYENIIIHMQLYLNRKFETGKKYINV